MGCSNECLADQVSQTWQRTMGSIFGMPIHERTRMAIVSVDDSIIQIRQAEDKLKSELFELAVQVRQSSAQARKSKKPTDDATANFLRRSRAKRQQLTSLHKKLIILESQKDTLHASEVNQQVFSSMQSTSAALKSIGLDKTLTSVDEVMQDLQESNSDVRAIQDGLAGDSMCGFEVSQADLDEELRFLLEDDLDCTTLIEIPAMRNRMHGTDKGHIGHVDYDPQSQKAQHTQHTAPVEDLTPQARENPQSTELVLQAGVHA